MSKLPTLLLVASVAFACARPPKISDTGYTGTWQRGNERVRSAVAIKKSGAAYKFRWSQSSDDEKWKLTCDWEGHCEELFDGRKIAEYTFEVLPDPRSGHLMVRSSRIGTTNHADDHIDLDELIVEPGGKGLWSYTIERDGETFERGKGPSRFLEKVADDVD